MREFPRWSFIDSFYIPKERFTHHLSSLCASDYTSSIMRLVFTHRFQEGLKIWDAPMLRTLPSHTWKCWKIFKLPKLHHPSLSNLNDYRTPVQPALCSINLRTRQLLSFHLHHALSHGMSKGTVLDSHATVKDSFHLCTFYSCNLRQLKNRTQDMSTQCSDFQLPLIHPIVEVPLTHRSHYKKWDYVQLPELRLLLQ